MNRSYFTLIFVALLLGYFFLFEGVTMPWSSAPEVPAENELEYLEPDAPATTEPAGPEMIENPYVKQQAGHPG